MPKPETTPVDMTPGLRAFATDIGDGPDPDAETRLDRDDRNGLRRRLGRVVRQEVPDRMTLRDAENLTRKILALFVKAWDDAADALSPGPTDLQSQIQRLTRRDEALDRSLTHIRGLIDGLATRIDRHEAAAAEPAASASPPRQTHPFDAFVQTIAHVVNRFEKDHNEAATEWFDTLATLAAKESS